MSRVPLRLFLLRLARMLRLPTNGRPATLLQLDFQKICLEGIVVPKCSCQVDKNRPIKEEDAGKIDSSDLIRIDSENNKPRDTNHTDDDSITHRLPLELALDLLLCLRIRFGITREAPRECLPEPGQFFTLGTQLKDANDTGRIRQARE